MTLVVVFDGACPAAFPTCAVYFMTHGLFILLPSSQKNDKHRFEILECEFLSTICFFASPILTFRGRNQYLDPTPLQNPYGSPHQFLLNKNIQVPLPQHNLPQLGRGYIFKANICRILSFHWFQRHQEDLFVASSEAPSLATSSDKVEAEAWRKQRAKFRSTTCCREIF